MVSESFENPHGFACRIDHCLMRIFPTETFRGPLLLFFFFFLIKNFACPLPFSALKSQRVSNLTILKLRWQVLRKLAAAVFSDVGVFDKLWDSGPRKRRRDVLRCILQEGLKKPYCLLPRMLLR